RECSTFPTRRSSDLGEIGRKFVAPRGCLSGRGTTVSIASARGTRRPYGTGLNRPYNRLGIKSIGLRRGEYGSGAHDHEDDDDRRGDSGYLVEHPQLFFGQRTLAFPELLEIADHPAMVARQRNNQQQFGDEPALAPIIAVEGEHQAEDPDDGQRWIEDDPPQPVLALDPLFVFVGSDGRLMM